VKLSAADLSTLISQGEGRRLEFKRGLPRGERIARSLCALANTSGGILLIGVDDHGRVVGVPEPREVAAELRQVARDLLAPPLALQIGSVELEGGRVVWCSIPLSHRRPHAVLRSDGSSEIVVRVGSSNRAARGATLRALSSPPPKRGLDALERRIVEWVRQRSSHRGEANGDATVAAFASTHNIGLQRARRSFTKLEREGRLVGHGPEPKRVYGTP
jgi:hypothetical protein